MPRLERLERLKRRDSVRSSSPELWDDDSKAGDQTGGRRSKSDVRRAGYAGLMKMNSAGIVFEPMLGLVRFGSVEPGWFSLIQAPSCLCFDDSSCDAKC